MEENKKFKLVSSKKTRYLLPNILTLAGVCLGISSIKFSIDGNYNLAVTLILIDSILDALDGRIARLIKGQLNLMPLIYELTNLNFGIEIKKITPYFTILVAIMLVSKVPTLALKKISISPKASVFLLLGIGIVFIALLFYTLETLLIFGTAYLISIPISIILYNNQNKKNLKISEESHEDIL